MKMVKVLSREEYEVEQHNARKSCVDGKKLDAIPPGKRELIPSHWKSIEV